MSNSDRETRWPVWKLAILLFPFVAAAVAINLFMLGLVGPWLGLPAMAPLTALWVSVPLGLPATWLASRWLRALMDEADG